MACDQGLIQRGEVWSFQGNQMVQLEHIDTLCDSGCMGKSVQVLMEG